MALFEIDNVPTPIDFQESDIVQRALQNAKNLLMCHMGEVPYDRLRGFDPALFSLPFPDFEEELLPELDRVLMWEPDVEVADAEASMNEDGTLYVKVTVNIPIGDRISGEE